MKKSVKRQAQYYVLQAVSYRDSNLIFKNQVAGIALIKHSPRLVMVDPFQSILLTTVLVLLYYLLCFLSI